MVNRWQSALLVAALPGMAGAQARISEVLVFPGGAEVQRVQTVAAGTQEAEFACIPARIQLDALLARGGTGLQVGEISVITEPSAAVRVFIASMSRTSTALKSM